jgi:DNA-binding NarL/FixJ family response regulator
MRTLIIHRKPLLRDSLAALLRARIADLVLTAMPSLPDGAFLMGQMPVGLLILEAEQAAGAQFLAAIRLIYPGWRIVLFGNHRAEAGAMLADGYLAADSDSETVIAEIGRLAARLDVPQGRNLPQGRDDHGDPHPPAAETWPRRPDAGAPRPTRALTRRQQDVLSLLVQGRSTKEIARTLDLGIGTIKAHLDGLYRTLGVHNRFEAVVRAQAPAPPDRSPGRRDADPAETAAALPEGRNVIRLDARIGPRAPAATEPAGHSVYGAG